MAHRYARARQRQEEFLVREKRIQDGFKVFQKAEWMAKTAKSAERTQIKAIAKSLERNHEERLRVRRRRLGDLLAAEEQHYMSELAKLQETPEERAQRLLSQARALKADREQARQEFARQQYLRQWRASCDDLRSIDAEKYRRHCTQYVTQQIEQNKVRRAQEKEDEQAWHGLWAQTCEALNQREEADMAAKKEQAARTAQLLRDQMAEREARRQAQLQEEASFRASFQAQLQEQDRKDKEQQRHEALEKMETCRRVVNYNNELRRHKQEMEAASKAQDRAFLQQSMVAYAQEQQEERADKERLQQEFRTYKAYREQRLAEEARTEAEVERLAKQAMDAANAKRDQERQRVEDARTRMMQTVLQQRQQQLVEREQDRQRERNAVLAEREAINHEIEAAKQLKILEEKQRKEKAFELRHDLQTQIALRENQQRIAEARKLQERELANQAEAQYRAFLAKEIQRAKLAIPSWATEHLKREEEAKRRAQQPL